MKSYFPAPIASRNNAIGALNAALPWQAEPWLLKDGSRDVTAYFSVVESDDTTGVRTIEADVSGRHYNKDADVISVLEEFRTKLGGGISNAP